MKITKFQKLFFCLILDAIGCVSYFFPALGEMSDLVWAPASAFIMTKLYKGQKGKVAGLVSLVEEAIPGLDIVPTFTIMWFYTYVLSKNNNTEEIK